MEKEQVSLRNKDETLMKKVDRLVLCEEIYKNQTLTLETLAVLLKINRTYLSRAINTITGKNFVQWINGYRIQESINLLTDNKHDKMSIEQIANKVGFNNRNSFYVFFKTMTGSSPAKFRKSRNNFK